MLRNKKKQQQQHLFSLNDFDVDECIVVHTIYSGTKKKKERKKNDKR